MKKFISVLTALLIVFTSLNAFAVTLEIDGTSVKSDMIFTDSTAYVPLSSIAKALDVPVDTDEKTQSYFLNGINLFATKGEGATVYVDGKKYIPTDSEAEIIVQNGEVYLPAHLAAEALGKDAVWYSETATLVLSTPAATVLPTVIDENTTYVIVNKGTGKVLSSTENSLTTEKYTGSDNQKFTIVKTEFEGYYHIKSVPSGFNLDVLSHGTTPGTQIITWEQGTGDNQKFKIEDIPGGTIICARSCHLPIEPYQNIVLQNTRNDNNINQKWAIVPAFSYSEASGEKAEKLVINYTPTEEEEVKVEAPYKTISLGGNYLSDINGLTTLPSDGSDSQKWIFVEAATGVYVITNLATNKSVDVSARSYESGGAIITYTTNSDANQRWVLEQNGDGSYYIKSVHSSLYLTISENGGLIQAEKDSSLKQRWTIEGTN